MLRVLEAEMAEAAGETGSEARFRALVKDDPRFVPARLGLARALESAGKIADSEKERSAARAIDPDHCVARRVSVRLGALAMPPVRVVQSRP